MTACELLNIAETTYPPTQIVMQTVWSRIGNAGQIADALKLGPYGRQRVRAWRHAPQLIPFSVWLTLLAIHEGAR